LHFDDIAKLLGLPPPDRKGGSLIVIEHQIWTCPRRRDWIIDWVPKAAKARLPGGAGTPETVAQSPDRTPPAICERH